MKIHRTNNTFGFFANTQNPDPKKPKELFSADPQINSIRIFQLVNYTYI
jgi:hypothetical protein